LAAAESRSYPRGSSITADKSIKGDDIKATGILLKHGMPLYKKCCRVGNTTLFVPIDCVNRTSVAAVGSLSHFNEYQRFTLAHDEVNLPAAGLKVLRDEL
jgi:hypothetical protein